MANTTTTTLAASVNTWIRDELLAIEQREVVFPQFALKAPLPQHESKTVRFVRYPRIPLPKTPATEGVTPTSQALSVETVDATVDQWILIVTLTDLAMLTITHPLIPVVTERLGLAKAELVDREVQTVLNGATNVVFVNNRASRAALTASDTLNKTEIQGVTAKLRNGGAHRFGRHFIMVVDPFVSQDVIAEDEFHSAHEFRDIMALYNAEIGVWMGHRFMESNLIHTIQLITNASWTAAAAAAGSWAGGDNQTVYVKVTGVDNQFGFEHLVSNAVAIADVDDGEKMNITTPSTAGYTYNIYVSDTDNTSADANLRLVATGIAPSTTVDLTSSTYGITDYPTSGDTPPASPPTGVVVHLSYAFGREAYGVVDLSGDNLRVMITDPRPTDSDPAMQRRKISLKGSFKAVILNNAWIRRVESASSFAE